MSPSDETFRNEARKLLEEQSASLRKHVPAGRPDASRFQVVFAIIKAGSRWRARLPFFSKLNLVRSAEVALASMFVCSRCSRSMSETAKATPARKKSPEERGMWGAEAGFRGLTF